MFDDALNGRINFPGKIMTKTNPALFILINGRKKFLFCFGMKFADHFPKHFHTFRNTSSPGMGLTLPDFNSPQTRFGF